MFIQLKVKIALFQTIQFSISTMFKCRNSSIFKKNQFSINTQFKCKNSKLSKPPFSSIWPIDRTLIRCNHSGSECTREWWQWRGTLHSPKIRHYWNLTLRLFSVICRTLVGGGVTPLQRCSRCILQPQTIRPFSFLWLANLHLKRKKNIKQKILALFLPIQLKFEIIWIRIGQVIKWQNDVNFLKHSVYFLGLLTLFCLGCIELHYFFFFCLGKNVKKHIVSAWKRFRNQTNFLLYVRKLFQFAVYCAYTHSTFLSFFFLFLLLLYKLYQPLILWLKYNS